MLWPHGQLTFEQGCKERRHDRAVNPKLCDLRPTPIIGPETTEHFIDGPFGLPHAVLNCRTTATDSSFGKIRDYHNSAPFSIEIGGLSRPFIGSFLHPTDG